MANTTIAYLEAFVGADVSSFRSAMTDVRRSLFDVGGAFAQLRDVGRTMTYAITVPIVGALTGGVVAATQFDAAMRNVAAISTDVAADFDNMSERVRAFGMETRGGATAAAEAFYEVFSAGVESTEAAFRVMEEGTALAEGGLTNMNTTTMALITSLQAFGHVSEEAIIENVERFSDTWTRTVQLGVGSLEVFQTAIGRTVASMSAVGASFEDGAASIAFLTTRGLKAYNAGTAMNNVFNKLILPSEKLVEVFRELGVESGRELIETMGGLEGALIAIRGVLGDNESAWAAAFNTAQAQRAINLIFQNMGDYSMFLDQFNSGLDGATDRARAQQLESFAAKLDMAKSAFVGFAIAVGQAVIPYITPIVTFFDNLFSSLASLDPGLIGLGVAVAAVVAAIPPLIWLLGALGTPFGLFTAAIAGLGALFVSNFDPIYNWLFVNAPPIVEFFKSILDAVRSFINFLNTGNLEELSIDTDPLRGGATNGGRGIGNPLIPIKNGGKGDLFGWADSVKEGEIWDGGAPFEKNIFEEAFAELTARIRNALVILGQELIKMFNEVLVPRFIELWERIGQWWETDAVPFIEAAVPAIVDWLKYELPVHFAKGLGFAAGTIAVLFAGLIGAIFGTASDIISSGTLAEAGGAAAEGFGAALSMFGLDGTDFGTNFAMSLVAAISSPLVLGIIISGLAGSGIGGAVLGGIGTGLLKLVGAAGSLLLLTPLKAVFFGLVTSLPTALGAPILAVVSSIFGMFGATFSLKTLVASLGYKVGAALASPILHGIITAVAIWSVVPEEVKRGIEVFRNNFINTIQEVFGQTPATDSQINASLQFAILRPFAQLLDDLEIEHGLWEMAGASINDARNAPDAVGNRLVELATDVATAIRDNFATAFNNTMAELTFREIMAPEPPLLSIINPQAYGAAIGQDVIDSVGIASGIIAADAGTTAFMLDPLAAATSTAGFTPKTSNKSGGGSTGIPSLDSLITAIETFGVSVVTSMQVAIAGLAVTIPILVGQFMLLEMLLIPIITNIMLMIANLAAAIGSVGGVSVSLPTTTPAAGTGNKNQPKSKGSGTTNIYVTSNDPAVIQRALQTNGYTTGGTGTRVTGGLVQVGRA